MDVTASNAGAVRPARNAGQTPLRIAAGLWFAVAVVGQLIFAVYIVAFYGGATLRNDHAAWNQVMPHGHVPGDTLGNGVVAVHVLVAAVLTFGGPLQLIPALRARAPRFHRWNGRLYLTTVTAVTVAGLTMVATRGTIGPPLQDPVQMFNGVLVLTCAAMALRHALAGNFVAHRRWALRLFVVASGVWFFRLGMAFWIAVTGGFNPATFDDLSLTLSIGQCMLPLLVLETYLRAWERGSVASRHAVAALLVALTLAMGYAISRAARGMWLPHII